MFGTDLSLYSTCGKLKISCLSDILFSENVPSGLWKFQAMFPQILF